MRVYTLHLAAAETISDAADPEIAAIKEGFCWPAMIATLLWALWHRLWWVALGFFVAEIGIAMAAALSGANAPVRVALSLAVLAGAGWFGNDLRRWTLGRRGLTEAGVVVAAGAEDAIRRFVTAGGIPAAATAPDQAQGQAQGRLW